LNEFSSIIDGDWTLVSVLSGFNWVLVMASCVVRSISS
jgi:hypothetical protein